ncbi:hypothetical protein [Gracilibacillus lacisalsi]|uniref:hypothetical protein n=1 Tax=Gracilibacillus lacisalsi TaxID=393087 RepID=UPI00037A3A8D|nr:hypothetical protein [Gracilibacillus lacisalsi]
MPEIVGIILFSLIVVVVIALIFLKHIEFIEPTIVQTQLFSIHLTIFGGFLSLHLTIIGLLIMLLGLIIGVLPSFSED